MKRAIRFFLSFGLVFCACGHAAQSPFIENKVQVIKRPPSLAGNIAANVSVYCYWYDPAENDTASDIETGIVLDPIHVLTKQCIVPPQVDENYFESITVGSPDPENKLEQGPWLAHVITATQDDNDLEILVTEKPMPLPSVIPATKAPELGDILYTITSYATDTGMNKVDFLTVSMVGHSSPPMIAPTSIAGNWWSPKGVPEPSGLDFAVLAPSCGSPEPAAFFNERNEFVGFNLGESDFVIPAKAPQRFVGIQPWGVGYNIAFVGAMLKPLLNQAGVVWLD